MSTSVPTSIVPLLRHKAAFRRRLLAWYDRHARDLPWRRTRNPYTVWISEIMLQQTQVAAVIPYFQKFLRAFPSVQRLAAAPENRVLKLWEGLGYYRRARDMREAAKQICRQGAFPVTAEEWRALPGVGPYTAGAIASIAQGQATPLVDGNVKRVLARLLEETRPLNDAQAVRRFWEAAGALVPSNRPGDFNQALMELGAECCTPKQPACVTCPVRRWCRAYQTGKQRELPVPARRPAVPHVHAVVAIIGREGRLFMTRRPSAGLLGGLWEFPGGKVEDGETQRQALNRELREELGLCLRAGKALGSVRHAYSHFTVELHAFACRWPGGTPVLPVSRVRWVTPEQARRLPLPRATQKILDLLENR